MIESTNVRFDEFVERNDVESKKKPKYCNMFIYVYEEALDNLPELQHKATKNQSVTPELYNALPKHQIAQLKQEVAPLLSEGNFENQIIDPILAKYTKNNHSP